MQRIRVNTCAHINQQSWTDRHIKHFKCCNECDWWSNTRIIVWFRWGQPYFPTFYYCHLLCPFGYHFIASTVLVLHQFSMSFIYIYFKGWKANLMPAGLTICLVVTFFIFGFMSAHTSISNKDSLYNLLLWSSKGFKTRFETMKIGKQWPVSHIGCKPTKWLMLRSDTDVDFSLSHDLKKMHLNIQVLSTDKVMPYMTYLTPFFPSANSGWKHDKGQ